MEKRAKNMVLMAWICVCVCVCVCVRATTTNSEGDEETRVKVYLHDTTLYKNASFNSATRELARSSTMSTAVNKFGEMYVFDDVLTSGPSIGSKRVGSAQGLYVYSGRLNSSAFWTATAFLGDRGSISFMGSEFLLNPSLRSLPVVGGTGFFARARGLVTLSTLAAKNPNYFVLSLDFHLST